MKFIFEMNEEMETLLKENVKGGKYEKVWIPAQEVYLFVPEQKINPMRVKETQAMYSALTEGIFPWMFQNYPLYYSQGLCLDVKESMVIKDGIRVTLSPVECLLLETLMQSAHNVMAREVLCACVEKVNVHPIMDNTLSAHMRRLRKKLCFGKDESEGKQYIDTIRSIGYRWLHDVETKIR